MLVALSLFLPLLVGLGCLVLQIHPALFPAPATRTEAARLLSLAMVLGILVDYTLVLVVGRLSVALTVAIVLALGGVMLTARSGWSRVRSIAGLGWRTWLLLGCVIAPYAVLILTLPLSEWDARSIWFLHGKMIFHNHATFDLAAGWNQPFAKFSHVAYPKLVPILAAQFAAAAGYWNEYLPKAALLALLTPAAVALFAFVPRLRVNTLYLFVMLLCSLSSWLWNGYMDGYLALYTGLACLFLGRWLGSVESLDLLCGIVFLAMGTSLKLEGALAAVCVACALIVCALARRRAQPSFRPDVPASVWGVAILSFVGPACWWGLKTLWGLPWEAPSSPKNLQLIGERIRHGAAGTIAGALLLTASVAKALAVSICAIVAGAIVKRRVPEAAWFALLAAALYGASLFLIYLTTSADLSWLLRTSAVRTILPVLHMLFVAVFFVMFELEDARQPSTRSA